MGRSHRPAGCLFAGVRREGAGAESDHHAVTGHVAGATAVLSDDAYEELEVALQEGDDPVWSEVFRGAGEAAHVDEHHRAVDLALTHGRFSPTAALTMRHAPRLSMLRPHLWAATATVRDLGSR